jgi:hypothetical protein
MVGKQGFAFVLSCALALTGCDFNERPSDTPHDARWRPRPANRIPLNPGEVQLASITTDAIPGIEFAFRGVVDAEKNAAGLRYLATDGSRKDFNIADLPTGLVLMTKSGRNVLTLISKNFDRRTGGTITLRYLYKGAVIGSDEYREFVMELDRAGDAWTLLKNTREGRKPFTRMFLRKNTTLGQVSGIKEIVTD